MPRAFTSLVIVALGGFFGATARFLVGSVLPVGFPWGTLAVNVTGSFALGALLSDASVARSISPRLRLLLATGFLSSFTTYSTFAVETVSLDPLLSVANVGLHYGLGVVAVLLGRFAIEVVAR